jgi:hypothetical protein
MHSYHTGDRPGVRKCRWHSTCSRPLEITALSPIVARQLFRPIQNNVFCYNRYISCFHLSIGGYRRSSRYQYQ